MRNLVIVSNRSPVDFKKSELKKGITPKFGEGGLAQAMVGLLKKRGEWNTIWCGASMGDADRDVIDGHYNYVLEKAFKSDPEKFPHITIDKNKRIRYIFKEYEFFMKKIFFDSSQMNRYYTNFSNGFLWPLFHLTEKLFYKEKNKAFPKPNFTPPDVVHYWASGVTFADAILDETIKSKNIWEKGKDFVVWIQDFHQLLTSSFYRMELENKGLSKEKNIHVGQFIHTPFFNRNLIKELIREDRKKKKKTYSRYMDDVLRELVESMLGNDFIGFHINQYCENFVNAVDYLLPNVIIKSRKNYYELRHDLSNKKTIIGAYPIGIDAEKILPEVTLDKQLNFKTKKINLETLINQGKEKGIIIFGGLERRDYTKGIPERIEIFDYMLQELQKNGKYAQFIQIAAKSRQDNPSYRNLDKILKEKIDETNKKFNLDYIPFIYIPEGITTPNNYDFMRDLNVLMITTKSDGLNLVALEGVTSKKYLPRNKRGIIAIGICGAAVVLKNAGFNEEDGIIYIDPSNIKESGDKILDAIGRYNISDKLINYVENNCKVSDWAEKNINSIINKTY